MASWDSGGPVEEDDIRRRGRGSVSLRDVTLQTEEEVIERAGR